MLLETNMMYDLADLNMPKEVDHLKDGGHSEPKEEEASTQSAPKEMLQSHAERNTSPGERQVVFKEADRRDKSRGLQFSDPIWFD